LLRFPLLMDKFWPGNTLNGQRQARMNRFMPIPKCMRLNTVY